MVVLMKAAINAYNSFKKPIVFGVFEKFAIHSEVSPERFHLIKIILFLKISFEMSVIFSRIISSKFTLELRYNDRIESSKQWTTYFTHLEPWSLGFNQLI